MNIWKHFCTINHHKILVMRGCFQVGLIRQGLLHDLSKYSPTEFIVGCKYYQGNMSPNNAEREAVGYSSAWLHHKGCISLVIRGTTFSNICLRTGRTSSLFRNADFTSGLTRQNSATGILKPCICCFHWAGSM